METDEILKLVVEAAMNIRGNRPPTQAQADALLTYCATLELANDHLREQIRALQTERMLGRLPALPAGSPYLQ